MAESGLMEALRQIAQQYGIDEYELLDRLERDLAPVYERVLKLEFHAKVILDRETGAIYVYELVPIGDFDPDSEPEEGEVREYEERDVTPPEVSRIAAHQAKSVINGMVRDARREKIFDDYVGRIGELVSGPVQQARGKFTIIKLDENLEAELPRRETPANEHYHFNERLKVYIVDVRRVSKANESSIIVSRKHPGLVKRLFEVEVPEVYDGIVEIKSIAREAGARSKVAVSSREPGLDPVGACVGPGGSRVRNVVQDLRGERIDIIAWDERPEVFVGNALAPAKVDRVLIDEASHTANIIVPADQLSLAIGKEGQNARLAAQLTGWRIDIKSADMAREAGLLEQTVSMDDLDEIDVMCQATTADGQRCRNHARPGSRYCGVHANWTEDADVDAAAETAGAADAGDGADGGAEAGVAADVAVDGAPEVAEVADAAGQESAGAAS
ncbi:MAG: transcription termination factor NusA [Actinomycetes bacterium]|jgi:N utilization substance protein A|nr:transcription termination factor NusA [Actinomycetes bacterium]